MIDFSVLPEHLLVPLVDSAGTTLRALPPDEVPPAVRPLLAFDRRGMTRGPARLQLRRALEGEEDFRERVFAEFRERADVRSVIDDWTSGGALAVANAAATDDGLALLASALVAAEPALADFGLGIVVAVDAMSQQEHAEDDEAVGVAARIEALEERVRRAEDARASLERERDALAEQLRIERRSRRERDERAAADTARAGLRIGELEAALERERERAAHAEEASARASERERASGSGRSCECARVRARRRAGGRAAAAAQRGRVRSCRRDRCRRARRRAVTDVRRGSGRRARPNLPGGLFADSVSGADAMLGSGSVLLVVDGYNVSKTGWPNASLEVERESLLSAVHSLHLTSGTDVIVAFDGDGTQSFTGPRRPGVRIVFSAPGEEADSVVVETVSKTPLRTPVVVASSDRWVREHAETFGAVVISAATLVAVLRKAPGRSAS